MAILHPADVASLFRNYLLVPNNIIFNRLTCVARFEIGDCPSSYRTAEDNRTALTQKVVVVFPDGRKDLVCYLVYRVNTVYSKTELSRLRKVKIYSRSDYSYIQEHVIDEELPHEVSCERIFDFFMDFIRSAVELMNIQRGM